MKSYRIRRYSNIGEKYIYFAGNVCDNINHWVLDKREAFIYFDKKKAQKDIKKYKLKKCEVYDED